MLSFQINDMTCGHCASTIAKAVSAMDKSARIEFDIPAKLVRISGTEPAADYAEAIREAGYTPQEIQAAPAASATRAAAGCGCGCGPQKTAPVDARQADAAAAGSCCS